MRRGRWRSTRLLHFRHRPVVVLQRSRLFRWCWLPQRRQPVELLDGSRRCQTSIMLRIRTGQLLGAQLDCYQTPVDDFWLVFCLRLDFVCLLVSYWTLASALTSIHRFHGVHASFARRGRSIFPSASPRAALLHRYTIAVLRPLPKEWWHSGGTRRVVRQTLHTWAGVPCSSPRPRQQMHSTGRAARRRADI